MKAGTDHKQQIIWWIHVKTHKTTEAEKTCLQEQYQNL